MVATPIQKPTADSLARGYIQAMLRQEKPAERPEVGKWAHCCGVLEESYEDAPESIATVLKALIGSKKYPGLRELVYGGNGEEGKGTSLQGVNGDEGEGGRMPVLPQEAVLAGGLLPQPCSNPRDDWFLAWDRRPLQGVSPWLAEYLTYSNQKSPEGYVDFHIASALWTLSVVAARRIYVPLADPVYTPLAIALVARTSLFAKTVTAQAGVKVLKAAGLGWLLGDDETTPQKLLSDMAGHIPGNYDEMDEGQKTMAERRLAMAGQRGWAYDEFNQLIDAMTRPGPMAEFAGLLRRLDDCHDEYKYSTRSHGQEVISNPYVPLLANTTPANLRRHTARHSEFWNDGFWARFAFITPPPGAWKTKTMEMGEVLVPQALSKALQGWHTRLGEPECVIVTKADIKGKKIGQPVAECQPLPRHTIYFEQDAYNAYVRYREALRGMLAESSNHDLDGSYVRLSDKALRVAALVASLENHDRINLAIWGLAQEIAEMFRRNLHELYNQVASGHIDDDPLEDILINFFKAQQQNNGQAITVRDICQYAPLVIRKLKAKTVRELLQGLEHDGIIECLKTGKKETYQLVQ